MPYEQIKQFYPKEMGKKKGWCLQNCRLGFRIYTGHYKNASLAMAAAKRNGTYHAGTPPNNIAVPVYTTSSTSNGHVVVYDKGAWWSDGKRYSKYSGVLGWDTRMDGVEVVKFTQSKNFLPEKGYWKEGDCDDRVGYLASFMRRNFPAYTSAKALGNYYGKYIKKSITEFQKRTGLYPDGCVGQKTYNMLKKYGFDY